MRYGRFYFVILILSTLLSSGSVCGGDQPGSNGPDYIFKTEFVVMKDKVKLATDVYLPANGSKFPCILFRTPYDKNGYKKEAEWFTKNGYAVVAQDCRGKFLSEGDFYPFQDERRDGLVTVKWIRRQSWSNGKIGGWDMSYVGYTQWAVSDELDALTPMQTGASLYELTYPGGLFSLDSEFSWALLVDSRTWNFVPREKFLSSYTVLPLSMIDDSIDKDCQFINDCLKHPSNDEFWKSNDHRGMATSPVLSIGGWYDMFLKGQIEDFQALGEKGHPDNRLVIGPWCHGTQRFKNEYGGEEKTGQPRYLSKRFLAKHLKGEDVKLMEAPFKDKKYNLFIMERNEYYGCDNWPPKATSFTNYYIGRDKYLAPEVPQKKGRLEYTYDPRDPYPNKGGTGFGEGVGPALQNDNLSRKDQVVFETAVLESPLVLLGPISATLYVSSDVPSTDFIVCLQDVFPNGNIINIQEGGTKVDFEEAGIQEIKFSVWATGYQLNTGHKLRAVITSSWFPRFNRSLNSGEPIFSAKTIKTAHQKIYFGPEHPSAITLPILRLEDMK